MIAGGRFGTRLRPAIQRALDVAVTGGIDPWQYSCSRTGPHPAAQRAPNRYAPPARVDERPQMNLRDFLATL